MSMDTLAGTWESLDGYVTLGGCSSAPSYAPAVVCAPYQLAGKGKDRLEFSGYLSATNSALDISDAIRKEKLTSTEVQEFFSKYNYSDFLVFARLQLMAGESGFLVGVSPVRLQGQLELHNPNLPLVTFALREDIQFFVAKAYNIPIGSLFLRMGAKGTVLRRKERIAEATIVDLAARAPSDIISVDSKNGSFFDLGLALEKPGAFQLSAAFSDLGGYWNGKRDRSNLYLFVDPDRVPRGNLGFSFIPELWSGVLQVGGGVHHFFNRNNEYSRQWMFNLSYYMGPLRLLSGVGEKVFRTGLGLSFSGYDVAVAQEWINEIETGRKAQPKFSLSISAAL